MACCDMSHTIVTAGYGVAHQAHQLLQPRHGSVDGVRVMLAVRQLGVQLALGVRVAQQHASRRVGRPPSRLRPLLSASSIRHCWVPFIATLRLLSMSSPCMYTGCILALAHFCHTYGVFPLLSGVPTSSFKACDGCLRLLCHRAPLACSMLCIRAGVSSQCGSRGPSWHACERAGMP
jgi:hypothetical protein